MCVSALVRRAGIFAGGGEMEKTNTCFEKALAIDSNAVDIFIHRARVSAHAHTHYVMPTGVQEFCMLSSTCMTTFTI